jgi:hypothetical protein
MQFFMSWNWITFVPLKYMLPGALALTMVYSIIFSQEPGQGRRVSRLPSVGDNIGFDIGTPHDLFGSQRSSLFPWDNAGMNSSSSAPGMPGSDQIYVDPVELKLRGSSQSRRSSSLIPSQIGSIAEGFSPAPLRQSSQALPEDYVFESMVFSDEFFGNCFCD